MPLRKAAVCASRWVLLAPIARDLPRWCARWMEVPAVHVGREQRLSWSFDRPWATLYVPPRGMTSPQVCKRATAAGSNSLRPSSLWTLVRGKGARQTVTRVRVGTGPHGTGNPSGMRVAALGRSDV